MSATFDTTTKAAYDAATTAAARATAIVASLSSGGSPQGSVLVKVYNGASPDAEMGSGTMSAPWATASGGTVVIGEVSSFTVGTTGTPNANWYIKFRTLDGTRWVRASFGLVGSGQDFTWSLATFTDGQTGTIGTATIVCTGNAAPVFTVAPTTASIAATGGTIQFTATDPDGGTILYSLTTTRSGITINSTTGLVTVTAAAAGTSGNIVVRASDGILTADASCAVTVASTSLKWFPGHYARTNQQTTPSVYTSRQAEYATTSGYTNIVGIAFEIKWGWLERTTQGSYDLTYLEREIEYISSLGKKAIINIGYQSYGGSLPTAPQGTATTLQRNLPDYILSAGWAANFSSGTGYGPRLDISGCMDRLIALLQHLGGVYDGDARVAGITVGETSSPVSGTNYTNLLTQWLRVPQPFAAAWPTTPVFVQNNYTNSKADTKTLTDRMVLYQVGMAGPDIYTYDSPYPESWGASCIRGRGGDFGTTDSRSVVPQMFEMQVIRGTSLTKEYINGLANDERKNNFTVWTIYYGSDPVEYGPPYATVPAFRWESASGVRQFINNAANAVTNTLVPSGY